MRYQSLEIATITAAGLVLAVAAYCQAALPAPTDVPRGPAKVQAPGDVALPSMTGRPPADAPAISMISDFTLPGETLVVTGDGLEAAHLRIWSGGRLLEVTPLRTAADRMQAVVPKQCPVSTMLVWPVKDGLAGVPIRVNGPTAWWAWPARAAAHSAGQTVRVFGKNLELGGHAPRVYLRGPGADTWLTVVDGNAYHIRAALPDNLDEGSYRVWCHNGTGGRWGWSELVRFDVVAVPSCDGLPTFHVDRFGAHADDGRDDWQAISSAIHAAEAAGGGIVRLGPGSYRLSRPLSIDRGGPNGIYFRGAGMGAHRWRNEPAPNDHKVVHQISGTATVIRPMSHRPWPEELLRISRRYSRLSDVTFLNRAEYGQQRCLTIAAHDVLIERVRAILVDERPPFAGWNVPESKVTREQYVRRLLDQPVMRIDAPGKANIIVRDCEFHHPGAGIDTPPLRGTVLTHGAESGPCPHGTDFIQIVGCTFRGYFDGRLEPYLKDRRWQSLRGWHNIAWMNNNSKNVIVERCDFAGADKKHFKVMTRMLNHSNTSIRELYLAHNTGHDLAPTSMSPGYHENKGEQILFHLWYPQGGLFDVVAAGTDSVPVDPSDPKYSPTGGRRPSVQFNDTHFSYVPKDVDVNPSHWVVFVCAGHGVGQYRVVRACERGDGRATLRLDKPWRVIPDTGSRITLNAAYRRIIIYGNELDGGYRDRVVKSHGVTFWANSFENVVAGNTFRNLTGGVVINAFYRCPTGWNLTRDNRIENIHGNGGDTVFPGRGAFYVDHVRVRNPRPEDRVWYTVGNVFRGNRCSGADVVAYLHRPDYARIDPNNPNLPQATRRLLLMPRGDNTVVGYEYPDTPNGGLMMSVLENNQFLDATQGIVISSPANWLLVRNNRIELSSPDRPKLVDESEGRGEAAGARDVLFIP